LIPELQIIQIGGSPNDVCPSFYIKGTDWQILTDHSDVRLRECKGMTLYGLHNDETGEYNNLNFTDELLGMITKIVKEKQQ